MKERQVCKTYRDVSNEWTADSATDRTTRQRSEENKEDLQKERNI